MSEVEVKPKKRGRPKGSTTKKKVTIKKDSEVLKPKDNKKLDVEDKLDLKSILKVPTEEELDDFTESEPESDAESSSVDDDDIDVDNDGIMSRIKNALTPGPEEDMYDQMRDRLKKMAFRNPQILAAQLDHNILKRINAMSDEEIEERLYFAERLHSNEFDKNIAASLLNVCNMGVGKFLNCYEELKHETDNNAELNRIIVQELGSILDFVPSKVKGALVYANSVGNAVYHKRNGFVPKPDRSTLPTEVPNKNTDQRPNNLSVL